MGAVVLGVSCGRSEQWHTGLGGRIASLTISMAGEDGSAVDGLSNGGGDESAEDEAELGRHGDSRGLTFTGGHEKTSWSLELLAGVG